MRRLRRIKILATLGPASSDSAMIRRLFEAGADVFRINMSHTSHDKMRELVKTIRNVESSYGRPIGILVDLQGPKLRLGSFAEGSIQLKNGESFVLDSDKTPGDNTRVQLPHPEILAALRPGHALLLDDGKVRLIAEETSPERAVTRVVIGGKMSDRKGVSLPDTDLPVSAMTPKDRADLEAALVTGVDWIALSFVQRAEDVIEAKKMIRGRAAVMAKIEKPQAIDRLAEIIEASDALMVARGDLGVELPLERVPSLQKQMTRLARRAGKPVVIATQMLESMIQSPVPTRAEVSDVATAVYEGADAIMLSAESAAGKFPVEAVSTMNRIGEEVERDPTYRDGADGAAARAGGDRRRRHRRRRAADRRDARSVGDHLLDQFGLDRDPRGARAAEAAGGGDHAEPRRPGANCPWSGACIAWSPKTPRTRTTWSTAPAASRFATALPGPASASSSSPACRSAFPAPPTWCASPLSARTATRICDGVRPPSFRGARQVVAVRRPPAFSPAVPPAPRGRGRGRPSRRRRAAPAASRFARRRAVSRDRPDFRRQRPDQRFMQRAEQRGRGERGVLRRQMSGADRGVDPGGDLAGDLAAAGEPRRRDVDIDRLGQNAPGELALRQHMHGNRGDGGGQRRGRPGRGIRRAADRGQFVARDLGDQFGNQIGLGGEIAVDGAGGDIGADRDRGDLHRGHAALGRGVPRRRQNGAAPRREPFYDLMGSPIDHGAFLVPGARLEPCGAGRKRASSMF